jgi:DNA invertase Pin-like site-specific DNA recombinase
MQQRTQTRAQSRAQAAQAAPLVRRLYSYLRFSDPRQASGTSIERQTEAARTWALANGYVFDDSLTMRDLGKSAFKGKHIEEGGALGLFLAAVREGRVEPGAILFVESLDRLSRATAMVAMSQMTLIIESGVSIITGSDNVLYSKETIAGNPGLLFMSLGVMIRAHDESNMKSNRVRNAVRIKCENWEKGERDIFVAAGKDPAWVRFDKEAKRFTLIEENAEPVRAMIRYFREGHGATAILARLRADGYTNPASISNTTRVYQIMRNRILTGEKSVTQDDHTFVLKGYYPALLDEAEFQSLQYLLDQRGRRPGRGATLPNLFTGMRLAFCGYCEHAMAAQNILDRSRQENGLPQDGHRRLLCLGRQNVNKCKHGSCSAVPVEKALMTFCSSQLRLSALLEGNDDPTRGIAGRLAIAQGEQKKLERKLKNITASIAECEDEDDTQRRFYQDEGRAIGKTLKTKREEVAHLEQELANARSQSVPAAADVWANLAHGVERLDHDSRTKARKLFADTFSRIDIYVRGFQPHDGEGQTIGIELFSKRGTSRVLEIDRVTGELLREGIELDDFRKPVTTPLARKKR